jgi:predicted amidophosphoribosyltransferase
MINTIKLKKAYSIASDLFSAALTPQLTSTLQKQSYSLITYIPAHPQKLRLRGFNLSEIFASKLSLLIDVPLQPLLQKNRHTTPQSELTAATRILNLNDVFQPTHASQNLQLQNSNILLVDDILTTGTTLETAATAIQKHYTPNSISAFVLCAK